MTFHSLADTQATGTEHESLGERLRRLRTATGCTVAEIAAAAGLHDYEIKGLEADLFDWPGSRALEALARVYGVSLDELTATPAPAPGGRGAGGEGRAMSTKHERQQHEALARATGSWRSWAVGQWFTNGHMALMLAEPISKHDMRLDFECLCDKMGKHEHSNSLDRLCVYVDAYERDDTMRPSLTKLLSNDRRIGGSRYVSIERDDPLYASNEPGMACYAARVNNEDNPRAWYAVQDRYVNAAEQYTNPDRWAVVQRSGTTTNPIVPLIIGLRGAQGVALLMPVTANGSAIEAQAPQP